jgi:hypothetical protein
MATICNEIPSFDATCPPPYNFSPSSIGDTTITLSWADTNPLFYELFIGDGEEWVPDTITTTNTTYTYINLDPGVVYYFKIRTHCGDNIFSDSAIITVVIPV